MLYLENICPNESVPVLVQPNLLGLYPDEDDFRFLLCSLYGLRINPARGESPRGEDPDGLIILSLKNRGIAPDYEGPGRYEE